MLGYRLASVHNIRFLTRLMGSARAAIAAGAYDAFADGFLARYQSTDERVRTEQKAKWAARFDPEGSRGE
jgi:queuine tRNA-ribosyltransferase